MPNHIDTKHAKYIFGGVLIFSLIFQLTMRIRAGESIPDTRMWANQLKFFIDRDPRVFNFLLAYGHPGTTMISLGSLFHILFGLSYVHALSVGMSILIASTAAACAMICYILHRDSLWWLTTAFILNFSRFYIFSTPPTSVVMPLIVLIILTTWLLLKQTSLQTGWGFISWGVIVGLSASTRLDITLLVGASMLALLWHRCGHRTLLPILTGAILCFFATDPFLWTMPIQHLKDLVYKFTLHYEHYRTPSNIRGNELSHSMPFAALGISWALLLLTRRQFSHIVRPQILVTLLLVSLFTVVCVLSSSFGTMRYFYPLIITWEVLLPLFALETLAPSSYQKPGSRIPFRALLIIGLAFGTQILIYPIRPDRNSIW